MAITCLLLRSAVLASCCVPLPVVSISVAATSYCRWTCKGGVSDQANHTIRGAKVLETKLSVCWAVRQACGAQLPRCQWRAANWTPSAGLDPATDAARCGCQDIGPANSARGPKRRQLYGAALRLNAVIRTLCGVQSVSAGDAAFGADGRLRVPAASEVCGSKIPRWLLLAAVQNIVSAAELMNCRRE